MFSGFSLGLLWLRVCVSVICLVALFGFGRGVYLCVVLLRGFGFCLHRLLVM